jgi:NAD(P)-dependent dehydrogenase (short-subunit alcohol dehydrogenase family)
LPWSPAADTVSAVPLPRVINLISRGNDRTSLEDWQSIIDINLTGTFLCCKHMAGVMVEQGRGLIINISSVAGHVGLLRSVLYCASKGAWRR